MKKFLALVLALVMVCSLSVTAFAAGDQTGTTTLTAEIPNAATPSYTIHVPANTTLEYGNTGKQNIGIVSVSDVTNATMILFIGSNTNLINTEDTSDEIALTLYAKDHDDDEDKPTQFAPDLSYAVYVYLISEAYIQYDILAEVADWSGATPGATYQAVVTFTFSA